MDKHAQRRSSLIGWGVVAVLAATGWFLQRGPAEPPRRLTTTTGFLTSELSDELSENKSVFGNVGIPVPVAPEDPAPVSPPVPAPPERIEPAPEPEAKPVPKGPMLPPKIVAPLAIPIDMLPSGGSVQPPIIDRPLESKGNPPRPGVVSGEIVLFQSFADAPLGFSGRSGILPREQQIDPRFVPVEDRWRVGFPQYDRYGKGHPPVDDYLFKRGAWWDPFNQNVLKGDYPIIGQHTFLEITASSITIAEPRLVPTATTPFESTVRPNTEQFFGFPNQLGLLQFFVMSIDLFHGDAAFKPVDWRLKITPIFNINYLDVSELGVVNPDVRKGRARGRSYFAVQEWFAETKIADLSPNYDFVSVRAGSQFFNSDFRGFIFTDTNRAFRIFGTRNSNREQFNAIFLSQQEKDTNSELNTFDSRDQEILILNYYIQDFIWPGYTAQFSLHYNHDDPSFHFDKNNVLVRPDPVGTFKPHGLDVVYLGWTGDGHINRYNINHALYWALGRDSQNPMANKGQDISAAMAALELSYDRDYIRFRTSFLWASGDEDPSNSHATGFDAIFDNPQFAGGEFSYWQRQAIRLFGVNLTNRGSLLPNLRSSKIQGQSNFVNPGLFLVNGGVDIDITPRFRMVNNVNFLWFDNTAVLEQFTYQAKIDQAIGTDVSMGFEYRPLLSNNCIVKFGVASLLPADGFRNIYNNLRSGVDPLFASFVDVMLTY